MPYKKAQRFTIAFSEKEGQIIKELAKQVDKTPYALLKEIITKELNLKNEQK